MTFDPLSWMVSHALGRIADRILKPSKNQELSRKLQETVDRWAKANDPVVRPTTLDQIFSFNADGSSESVQKARAELAAVIKKSLIPKAKQIHDALVERWDEVTSSLPSRDLQEFFQVPRETAVEQLDTLATQLETTFQQHDDLFQVTVVEMLKELKEILGDRPNGKSQSQSPQFPVFTVPHIRHTCFEGRSDVLKDLRKALTSGGRSALTQAISGLGGIGKTQTAVEYTYEHRDDYQAVLWINAATEVEVKQDMFTVAGLLGLPQDPHDTDGTARGVIDWLEHNTEWLLIFDNADEPELLRHLMPRTDNGHVLLTSRADTFAALGILSPIELPLLEVEDAVTFLLKRTGREKCDGAERAAAHNLATELGLLPLALEQAAAYMRATQFTFTAYLDRYRERRLDLLKRSRPEMGGYEEIVSTTWLTNFEQVRADSQPAADLLRLSAFLAPESIPFKLILDGISKTEDTLADAIAQSNDASLVLHELLALLSRFSLVTVNANDESFSVHRLVQEAVKLHQGEDESRMWTERVVELVGGALPSIEFENWSHCSEILPHAIAVMKQASELDIHTVSAGLLANQAAYFLDDQAQFADAEPLYKQSIEIKRVALGEHHPSFATSLNNLAGLYREMGRHDKAEQLYKQAMDIRRVALGERHPDFAASLNNLASLYDDMSRHDEAEPLYKLAMEIWRVALGEQHPSFAASLNNLAALYYAMGRHDEAEPLFKQAMEIRRVALGEHHPSFATSLNNLAGLYREMGRHDEAEPLFKQAMEIRRVALGEQHPDFAASLNNLASIYREMNRQAEAEPLLKQAMEIRRVALGEQHPDFAASLNNLAALHRELGRHDEAEPLFEQAMEIWRVAFGEQHPDFATSLNNLAGLYHITGRHAEAEPLYKQAMEIRCVALGEQHPDFAASLNNLAGLYDEMGRHDEAEPLYKLAMEIWRVALGEQHPDFATSLNNLAMLYDAMSRHDEAEQLYKQSMEIWRVAFGEQHPSFATVLKNLAAFYRATGRHAEADELRNKLSS